MKTKLSIILASLAVVGTLSVAVPLVHAQQPKNGSSAAPAFQKDPAMHAALRDLEDAKAHLAKAKKKFGGHKRAAVLAVDHAIAEVKAGIQFTDKKH